MASLPPIQASDGAPSSGRSAHRKQAMPGFEALFGQAVQGALPLPAVASAKAGSASAASGEQAQTASKHIARVAERATGRIPEGILEAIRTLRGSTKPLANKAAVFPALPGPPKAISSKDVHAETRAETPLGQLDARRVHLTARARKATPSTSATPIQPERTAVVPPRAPSMQEAHPLDGDRPMPGFTFRVTSERTASPSKSAADATARNDNAMLRQLADMRIPLPFIQGLPRMAEATVRGTPPHEAPVVAAGRPAERAPDGASDKKGPVRSRSEAHVSRPESGIEAAPQAPVAEPAAAMKPRASRGEDARRTPAAEHDKPQTPIAAQLEAPADAARATMATEHSDGRRDKPAERPAGAALAPARGSDTPAPSGAEKATRQGGARAAQTPEWVQVILNRGPEAPGAVGSKTLEMQLDKGDGIVTINVLRNPEKVLVSIGFSDPALRAQSEAQMAQIVDALQMHYQADVDVSFSQSGGESVFDQTPARPRGGAHGPSHGETADPEAIKPEQSRAGIDGRYVWVG